MSDSIIVVPCYNEAARLDVAAFQRFVFQGHPQRFLLVDDGSADGTCDLLQRLADWNPERFLVHRLPQNQGKAEAVRQGILAALTRRPEILGFWDADLAAPLEAIPELCRLLESNARLQVILGSRVPLLGRQIQRPRLRRLLGRTFATAASLVLGLRVYDTQCGAKLFRVSPLVHYLFARPFCARWIFDVELLARLMAAARASGRLVEEIVLEAPLLQWHDVAGSKLRVRDFGNALLDLGRIWWKYRRTTVAAEDLEMVSPQTSVDGLGAAAGLPGSAVTIGQVNRGAPQSSIDGTVATPATESQRGAA
jgi:dolichyl-phosphate beta-glucosyltransferase